MKKLSKIIITAYILWGVVSEVLFVFHVINIWTATAFLWLPLGVLFSVALFLVIAVAIGNRLKGNTEPSCENCLFGQNRGITGHCIGESMGETFGVVCPFHKESGNTGK